MLRRMRIARCPKAPIPKCAKNGVDVVCRDRDDGAVDAIAGMAGKEQVVTIAGENAERRIVEFIVAVYTLEIEDVSVKPKRVPHATATERRDDRHEFTSFAILSVLASKV